MKWVSFLHYELTKTERRRGPLDRRKHRSWSIGSKWTKKKTCAFLEARLHGMYPMGVSLSRWIPT